MIVSHVSTTLHHTVITTACWMTVAFACSDSDYYPASDTDSSYFRWYSSYECRRMPNEMYGLTIMFSVGYIIWDSFRMLFYDTDWKLLDRQMMGHHVVAGLGIALPLISGFGAPAIANNLLLTETSSFFLEVRYMLPVTWRSPRCAGIIADALFFLSFTVTRIILMPFTIYICYEETISTWPINGYWQVFTIFPSLLCVGLYFLNLYWYIKILRVLGVLGGAEKVELPPEEARAKELQDQESVPIKDNMARIDSNN